MPLSVYRPHPHVDHTFSQQQQQSLAMDFQVYEVDNECMVAELPEEIA